MKRGKRKGIDRPCACKIEESDIFVRGDIVSLDLTNGVNVEFPKDWGLIHDPKGECVDFCEVFIAPFGLGKRLSKSEVQRVGSDARLYYGSDTVLHDARVEIPEGPWDRVGDIACIYYDRYGDLEAPYYHKTDVPRRRSERAILFKQRSPKALLGHRVRAYRISLPDGCKITAHGFVWP